MPKEIVGDKKELKKEVTNGKRNIQKKPILEKNTKTSQKLENNIKGKNINSKSKNIISKDKKINVKSTDSKNIKSKVAVSNNNSKRKPTLSKIRSEKKKAKKDNRIIKEVDLRKEKVRKTC